MRTPQFAVGQRVRVRAAFPPDHIRTPYYTRGCVGTVASLMGLDPNPEHLAYGRLDHPPVPLYRCSFGRQTSGQCTAASPRIRRWWTSLNTGWRPSMMPDHPHGHPLQPDLEDASCTGYQVMAQALEELLLDKGIIMAEAMDAPPPPTGRGWWRTAGSTRPSKP